MSVEVTAPGQREAWRQNVLPDTEAVKPGFWSIAVPIPDNPLRYVLVYAIECDDGVVVIDTGWSTDDAWHALRSGLEKAGFGVKDVRGALITHIHPYHYGLAGRLREESGCWVAVNPADAAMLPARYGMDIDGLLLAMRNLLSDHGAPEDTLAELSKASLGIREFVSLVEPDILLEDGKTFELKGRTLKVIHTPGHSAGHCCFYEPREQFLISGDHVLPRVTPNISVHAQNFGNPLADYLDALIRVRALEVREVLPAHEWRFRPLVGRVDELIAHHERRLLETENLLEQRPGSTVFQLAQLLPWSARWEKLGGFQRRAAMGETLSHLTLLQSRGRVSPTRETPVRWYKVSR